jgi:DNA-binding transcriptional MerR regulator
LHQRHPLYIASRITQMSREFGVTVRALRFYENHGLLSPARQQGARVYSRRDQARLSLVLKARRFGFSLSEIRDLLDLYDREGRTAQLVKALPRMREQLSVLETRRDQLDTAIAALKDAAARLSPASDGTDLDQGINQLRSRHG